MGLIALGESGAQETQVGKRDHSGQEKGKERSEGRDLMSES